MVDLSIDDIARFGIVRDVDDFAIPPEAWTTANNMRAIDEGMERLGGKTQVFGTPTVAPHFLLPVQSPSAVFWIYTSLTKAYVYDGSSHTDITRAAGNYTASATKDWNGVLFGGIPILNNGADAVQFWSTLSVGTKLAALTNWPVGATCRTIRALGPYLMAFDVTLAGTRYAHMVLWSHPADPGSIPSSWDTTDATKDAGQYDLPDVLAGIIKDAMPLRGRMYAYKEGSTWRITPIASGFIFDFDTLYETSGILTSRCVALVPDGSRHFVATQDDIILHDGASDPQSILSKRARRYLFNQIDTANFANSFVFAHPSKQEVWFCYPTSGNTNPDRALIWNAKSGGVTEGDVNFRNAAVGNIQGAADQIWSAASDTWAAYVGPWAQYVRRQTLVANTDSTKILELDVGATNDGAAITGTLQRTALALVGRKRNGEWIVDFHKRKQVNRIRPKLTGGPVNVRVGFQELIDGPITWSDSQSFDPTTDLWVDVAGSGQAIAVEFQAATSFRLSGYVVELEVIGEY